MPISKSGTSATKFYDALDTLQTSMSEADLISLEASRKTGLEDIESAGKQAKYKYAGSGMEMIGKYAGYKKGRIEAEEDISFLTEKTGTTYERDYGKYTDETMWGRHMRWQQDVGVFLGTVDPMYIPTSKDGVTGEPQKGSMISSAAAIHRAIIAYPELGKSAALLGFNPEKVSSAATEILKSGGNTNSSEIINASSNLDQTTNPEYNVKGGLKMLDDKYNKYKNQRNL